LTGIANRRAFLEMAAAAFAEARQRGGSVACLMADIDEFKRINDTYGHSSGDDIIQRVAEAAVGIVRSREKVCRYGGEEFCILLPNADSRQAAGVAEQLRLAVNGQGFADYPVSISVGVAALRDSGAGNVTELINQADEALYAAKAAGRNQVVRFETVHAWR
jgi:diguanylate cyclase (GGDEF)-like protein